MDRDQPAYASSPKNRSWDIYPPFGVLGTLAAQCEKASINETVMLAISLFIYFEAQRKSIALRVC